MALRSRAETAYLWIPSIPASSRHPRINCGGPVHAASDAAHITRIALFVHGDRNGWR
jgi:hypothetical protein